MSSPATLAMIVVRIAASIANAQEEEKPASKPQVLPAEVIRRLKDEAAKVSAGGLSELFQTLTEPRIRAKLLLAAEQVDLVGRLEKLTCEVIKEWLLRDVNATPLPPPDVLAACAQASSPTLWIDTSPRPLIRFELRPERNHRGYPPSICSYPSDVHRRPFSRPRRG